MREPSLTLPRICACGCGRPLIRHPGERGGSWAVRRYASQSCADQGRYLARVARRAKVDIAASSAAGWPKLKVIFAEQPPDAYRTVTERDREDLARMVSWCGGRP